MALLIGHTENFDHSMLYQCRSYHSLHALIFALDATAVGRLSTITRVVSQSIVGMLRPQAIPITATRDQIFCGSRGQVTNAYTTYWVILERLQQLPKVAPKISRSSSPSFSCGAPHYLTTRRSCCHQCLCSAVRLIISFSTLVQHTCLMIVRPLFFCLIPEWRALW